MSGSLGFGYQHLDERRKDDVAYRLEIKSDKMLLRRSTRFTVRR